MRLLTRYILREWFRVLGVTVLGFPILVIAIDVTDNLSIFLARGLSRDAVALSYLYFMPENMFLVLPAAVLFATVFTIGNLGRHSELIAAHASGISFFRLTTPILIAAFFSMFGGVALAEVMPGAARRRAELLGEKETRSRNTRYNFVYRADEGWVYSIRALESATNEMRDPVFERHGSGPEYPTISVQANRGRYRDSTATWTLATGQIRYIHSATEVRSFSFDSLIPRALVQTPEDLLAEPKEPEEMRYGELGRYIDALRRSGTDARKLTVERGLKLSIPATCFIIALFGAPLAVTSPRHGTAWGVAVSLGTTVVFLLSVQLSKSIGASGVLPETFAAWLPNILFGVAGIFLYTRAKT